MQSDIYLKFLGINPAATERRGKTMDEGCLLVKRAELLEIECEMNGMIALNKYREMRDETIAYDDKQFEDLANRCRTIQNIIWENR